MLITGKTPKILEGFKAFDSGVAELKKNLEETIRVSTLDEVGSKLNALQKKIDFSAIERAMAVLKKEIEDNDSKAKKDLETRLTSLKSELSLADQGNVNSVKDLNEEIQNIQTQIANILSRKPIEIPDFGLQITKTEKALRTLITNIEEQEVVDADEIRTQVIGLEDSLKKIRLELIDRINSQGAGNMNREELFNGVKRLTKYTDINWKAGANVTFTISNNETLKTTDVTIAATGGGPGGTTRVITSVNSNTAADSATGTDYVYLCSGTMTLTLPTAVANTNLYTVKNVGTGVITIATTGAQTIDNDLTIIMPVRYTSVDLISDTANWNIT
jgi:hypothetical protein